MARLGLHVNRPLSGDQRQPLACCLAARLDGASQNPDGLACARARPPHCKVGVLPAGNRCGVVAAPGQILASHDANAALADQGNVGIRHVRHLSLPGAGVLVAGVDQGVGQLLLLTMPLRLLVRAAAGASASSERACAGLAASGRAGQAHGLVCAGSLVEGAGQLLHLLGQGDACGVVAGAFPVWPRPLFRLWC